MVSVSVAQLDHADAQTIKSELGARARLQNGQSEKSRNDRQTGRWNCVFFHSVFFLKTEPLARAIGVVLVVGNPPLGMLHWISHNTVCESVVVESD